MQGSHVSWTPLEDLQQWSHSLAPSNEQKPPVANENEMERPGSPVSPVSTYVPADVETTDRKPKRKYKKRSIFLAALTVIIILGLIAAVVVESRSHRASKPPPPATTSSPPRPTYNGTATFNNYTSQANTVCGPKTANVTGYYGAAASDISPNISGGQCSGSINMSLCTDIDPSSLSSSNSSNNNNNITVTQNTTTPYPRYNGPACPHTNCGLCYQVTMLGFLDAEGGAEVGATGRNITVQIIDSCPATHALNYCKANAPYSVPANQRCGSTSTNQLDIDVGAYEALTGQNWTESSGNLEIGIAPVEC
ncbi:MAG: hypothetical protein FRX48_02528 [Lasallia pustulata]|uniref:RlpA-like double-psi beta-barrel domain n=1 Tax=Lasallia pustulata TaxID=136370 RepID=A0A5M8PYR7_9LECA|nr:MAG: hypothetical protein FRX48_02528 [Lasallia pustulata]